RFQETCATLQKKKKKKKKKKKDINFVATTNLYNTDTDECRKELLIAAFMKWTKLFLLKKLVVHCHNEPIYFENEDERGNAMKALEYHHDAKIENEVFHRLAADGINPNILNSLLSYLREHDQFEVSDWANKSPELWDDKEEIAKTLIVAERKEIISIKKSKKILRSGF
ncbi:hypothetical protein RFI_26177, partial [Reticulomyxa filosa]